MASEIPPQPHGLDSFRSHSVYSSNGLSSFGCRALAFSITVFHSVPVGSASSQFLRVMTYCGFPSVLAPLPKSPTSIILTALLMTFALSSRLFFSIARWVISVAPASGSGFLRFAGVVPASLAVLSRVLHSLAMKLSTLPLISLAWSCRLPLGFTSSHLGSRYSSRAQLSCSSLPSNGWVQFPVPGGPCAMYEWYPYSASAKSLLWCTSSAMRSGRVPSPPAPEPLGALLIPSVHCWKLNVSPVSSSGLVGRLCSTRMNALTTALLAVSGTYSTVLPSQWAM